MKLHLFVLPFFCLILGACHNDQPAISPERRWQIYDIAWSRGFSDRLTPLSPDWTRHRQKLAPFQDVPERERLFITGYDDGFHQHPEEERAIGEMAYDSGYRQGRLDAWKHQPANSQSDAFDHEAYAKGYGDGFNGRSHQYQRPY